MIGHQEHVFSHPRTGVFWYRRVVPPRLRPVLDDVPGFPAKPGRRELIISLRTKDCREAHVRAAGYAQGVAKAFARAEAMVMSRPPAVLDVPPANMIRPAVALAAIAAWQRAEIARREIHHFNLPAETETVMPGSDPAGGITVSARMLDAEAIADRERALHECLATSADWPAGFDGALAAALASEGVVIGADHPGIPRLRRPFAEALRAVLQAEASMCAPWWPGPAPTRQETPAAPVQGVGEPFLDRAGAWAAQLGMKPRQVGEYLSDVKRFAGGTPGLTTEAVDKSHAREWVKALAKDGRAEPTIVRKLSALRSYWKYLQAERVVSDDHNPFAKVPLPGSVTARRDPADRRQPFPREDVVKLWRAASDDQPLADLIRLAAFSGGRIESLCQLTAREVQTDESGIRYFQFSDKTDAGLRKVPVHPAIKAMVDRLLNDSRDGYLIPVHAARQGGERSVGIGKRFGRLKQRFGYGPSHVFHSIRKTVATAFENARCPESTAADILGHDKPTMTYGLYSGGSDLAERLHWVATALDYRDAEFAQG